MKRQCFRLVAMLLAAVAAAPAQDPVKLGVSEIRNGGLQPAEISGILQDGSAKLFIDEQTLCGLNLSANLPVGDVSDRFAIIADPDLRELCQLNKAFRIYVVKAILTCGEEANFINGCIAPDRACIAVVHSDGPVSDGDKSLWMHEYGHKQKLEHVNGAFDKNLMNSSLVSNQFHVNQAQCDQIKSPNPTPLPTPAATSAKVELPPPLDDFLASNYIHGVPLEQAGQYYDKVNDLVSRLKSFPENDKLCRKANPKADHSQLVCVSPGVYWLNVVMILGMTGDDVQVDALIAFLNSPPGPDTKQAYQARLAVPLALGYILRRNKNSPKALKTLQDWALPDTWKTQKFNLFSESQDQASEEQDSSSLGLAKAAILGLGLSGKYEAHQYLLELKKSDDKRLDHKFFDSLLAHAIALNPPPAQPSPH